MDLAVNVALERHLSLLVPGLFGVATASSQGVPVPLVPALETLLARADRLEVAGDSRDEESRATSRSVTVARIPVTAGTVETRVFALFGLRAADNADLPVAAVTRVADGGDPDAAWWLRADPVCLQPQGAGLVLYDRPEPPLTHDQAQALADDILQVFAADGWHLDAPTPQRWYLRLATAPAIQTSALACVAGRDIHSYLPTGKDAKAWHVILNEIQILLHTCDVNVEREALGHLPINSLWFWGGGRLPATPVVDWTHVGSNEPVSQGLARICALPLSPLPTNATAWLDQAAAGRHLLVFDPEQRAQPTFLAQLEQHWIVPLLAALKTNAIQSVTLYTEDGPGFLITRKTLGRWWRRRRRVSDYGNNTVVGAQPRTSLESMDGRGRALSGTSAGESMDGRGRALSGTSAENKRRGLV